MFPFTEEVAGMWTTSWTQLLRDKKPQDCGSCSFIKYKFPI